MSRDCFGKLWLKGAGASDMLKKIFLVFFLLICLVAGSHADSDDIHEQINTQMLAYLAAFERCEQEAFQRELPEPKVLKALLKLDTKTQEQFLFARSFHVRNQCERPQLTELAYTLLLAEHADLMTATRELIEDIKILAFSNNTLRFKRLYDGLPADVVSNMEEYDYFQKPFNERTILEQLKQYGSSVD